MKLLWNLNLSQGNCHRGAELSKASPISLTVKQRRSVLAAGETGRSSVTSLSDGLVLIKPNVFNLVADVTEVFPLLL